MPHYRTHRHLLVLSGVVAALAVAGCGDSEDDTGASKSKTTTTTNAQDQAQAQVCSARAGIKSQIDTITALEPTRASLPALASGAQAIQTDLKQIADAQPDLSPERRDEVKAAGTTFKSEVEKIARQAVTSGVTGDAGAAISTAADQLAASFKSALAPIDCS
jgi:translation initiation factor 2B subunit (eIF-2B alpha/beta/delta family)